MCNKWWDLGFNFYSSISSWKLSVFNFIDHGIDKINSQQQLEESFQNCIAKANQVIPHDRKSRTYISLAATAGMRVLK